MHQLPPPAMDMQIIDTCPLLEDKLITEYKPYRGKISTECNSSYHFYGLCSSNIATYTTYVAR